MSEGAPTRRSFLSYATGGGVAVGALVALGGLGRSCAPVSARTVTFDLSDMQDGESRFYSFDAFAQIVTRTGDTLAVFDGVCPLEGRFHHGLRPTYRDNLLFCGYCTSRFAPTGEIIKYWGNRTPPQNAPNLKAGQVIAEGLTLIIAEDQPLPELKWSMP